ncbi:hypothetical protein ACPOLB_17215 [Rubrivivax sp. RP6-9]|uniref:hypothetical protein n=1 Tax=Rubrivivax sp. RP6-9 TaxID=3415750 RepID=UPI003CC681CB
MTALQSLSLTSVSPPGDADARRPAVASDAGDPIEQLALAEHADWLLLRLVLCAAGATLLLAVASSLGL